MRPSVRSNRLLEAGIKLLLPLVALAFTLSVMPASANAAGPITLTSGPPEGGTTKERVVTFGISYVTSANKDVEFFCSMDDAVLFQPCQNVASPRCTTSGATQICVQTSRMFMTRDVKAYVFRAFASECTSSCEPFSEGIDGPILVRNFSIDRTAPSFKLASGPSYRRPVTRGKPKFTFSANEPVAYTCAMDDEPALPCDSPAVFDDIRNGLHALTVNATDRAGNVGSPLLVDFKVDLFKPKRCKRGSSANAKSKHRKCVKANAKAKARWKKRNRLK